MLRSGLCIRPGSDPSDAACDSTTGALCAREIGAALGGRETGAALCGRGAGAALCCALPRWSVTGDPDAPGIGVAGITAGLCAREGCTCGSPGDGVDADTRTGVTGCADGCTALVSFVTFCVGARRVSPAGSRAPHPPQNRESGSFWVPQLAQRIPPQA